MFAPDSRAPVATRISLVVSACCVATIACVGPGISRDTLPAPQAPESDVSPPPQPTAVDTPPDSPPVDVTYEGVSFAIDGALVGQVVPELVPAEPFLGGETIPDYVRFSLDGYPLRDTFHEPQLFIYPVAEFESNSELAAVIIAELEQLLADKPATTEGIPFLPLFNAAQLMRAKIEYLEFQNGEGVRFVTQYAQAAVPINNREVFYTFQGLTHDRGFYVAAIMPVSHPSLAQDDTSIPGGDYDAFAIGFETYVADVEQELSAQDPASFIPDLGLLDDMIVSLAVTPS